MNEEATRTDQSAAAHIRSFAEAALMVAASTLAGLALAARWGNSAVDLLYLPAVLAAAMLGGLRPALLAALGSALAYNFFFTAPHRTFRINDPADVVTVVVLFLVAVVASHLAASVRRQAQIAAGHASRNATIAGFARSLLSCANENEVTSVTTTCLEALFGCNAVLLPNQPEPELFNRSRAVRLTPSDLAAAALTLETGQPAGRGVTRVDAVEWQFHAVSANEEVLAAVGLARDDGLPPVPNDQRQLLDSLLDQVALALERARLEEKAREFAALRERDRLRTALLATIGDDLKPSLTEITSSVAQLRRTGAADKAVIGSLAAEAFKLDRYISNLVDLGSDADDQPVRAGELTIDLSRRQVSRNGEEVHLTPKEYAVLAELAKYPGRVLTHAHLLRAVWGPAQQHQNDYLRVAIRALRQKLEPDPAHPEVILNEPAVGYRLAAI